MVDRSRHPFSRIKCWNDCLPEEVRLERRLPQKPRLPAPAGAPGYWAVTRSSLCCSATIVDPADIATGGQTDESEFDLLLYEFKNDLNAYLGGLKPNVTVRSLSDVIEFNTKNAARELRYFGQEILEQAQKKGPLTEKKYIDTSRLRFPLSVRE